MKSLSRLKFLAAMAMTAGLAVVVSGCGGGGSSAPTPPPAPTTCAARTVNWTVGGNACSAPVAQTPVSTNAAVTNTTAGLNGAATFACAADGNFSANPLATPAATCAPPPPTSCAARTLTWTVGGNQCSAPIAQINVGMTATIANVTSGVLGSATYACGTDGSFGTAPLANPAASCTTPPVTGPVGAITGLVINANTGSGIAGATVKSGSVTATTDAQGRYAMTGVPAAARTTVRVDVAQFAEGLSVVSVPQNGTGTAVTRVLPVGIVATIDAAAGGTVQVPNSPARVVLPAGAFAGTGSITIAVTPINPALDSAVMPGDFTTNNGSSAIESFGAIAITPRNAAGQPVNLAAGRSATIRIAAVSRGGSLPATIPLFFVDQATGSWVQEGTATLAGTAPNQYYEGTVTHFSVWNADRVAETITVTGCVQNAAGVRVAGVNVRSDGSDYIGYASSATNASGSFTVSMKRGGIATIGGSFGSDQITNTVNAGPSQSNITISQCLVLAPLANAVRIKLTWGLQPSDVDSHLFTPDGDEVYYADRGSLTAQPFANLDVDDTSSFGPEVITLSRLMVGTYLYGVKNFSGTDAPNNMTNSPVRVELTAGGQTRVFTMPAGETNSLNFVSLFRLRVDSTCNITVEPVGTWSADRPARFPTATPTYCVRP
jgi:hypothetical protein